MLGTRIRLENKVCPLYHLSKAVRLFFPRYRCQLAFDFSDHIVLFAVQYIFPSFLEIVHISSTHGFLSDTPEISAKSSYGIARTLYWIPFIVALGLILVCLRCMIFTMLFFHTPKENLVAVMVVAIFPYIFFFLEYPRKVLEKVFVTS